MEKQGSKGPNVNITLENLQGAPPSKGRQLSFLQSCQQSSSSSGQYEVKVAFGRGYSERDKAFISCYLY